MNAFWIVILILLFTATLIISSLLTYRIRRRRSGTADEQQTGADKPSGDENTGA